MVPWKVFWIPVGGAATLAAGGIPALLGVKFYFVIIAAVILGLITMKVVAEIVHRYCEMFRSKSFGDRGTIVSLINTAVLFHIAWIALLQIRPEWATILIMSLIAMGGIEYGVAWTYEYLEEHREPAPPPPPTNSEGRELNEKERDFSDALIMCGHPRVEVLEASSVINGGNS